MRFQFETGFCYGKALKLANRQKNKDEKQGKDVHPKALDAFLKKDMEAGRIELGVMDIPTDRIIGVAESKGRELYASNFLPLSPKKSNYAIQWRELCLDYQEGNEFFSPVRCCEYLGQFYVMDGKKRVSVLKYLEVPSVLANVIRIIPAMSKDKEVQNYFEFLRNFEKTNLYQISFSRQGGFEKLQRAMGHAPDQVWNDEERKRILRDLKRVAPALREAFGGYLKVTPADALLILLDEFSLEQIRRTAVSVLTDCIQKNWKKFYSMCHSDIEMV